MRRFINTCSTLLLLFLSCFAQAQSGYCIEGRFGQDSIFSATQVLVETDLVYGTATHFLTGADVELKADIYYPDTEIDDLEQRPFILLIHGGAFSGGSKEQMSSQCLEYAKRGYVAATISYRLGWNCAAGDFLSMCLLCSGEGMNLRRAAYQASQDARAALRFFSYNADDWGLDADAMFIGGASAGSITALHAVYWDQEEANAFAPGFEDTAGSLDESGNELTNTWEIKGIINNCGAVNNLSILDNNELLPIVSFHDDGDCIVPFNCGNVIGCFCTSFFAACGSNQIHNYYAQQGQPSQLNVVQLSLGHCSYPLPQVIDHGACFMKHTMCGIAVYSTNHNTSAPAICSSMALDTNDCSDCVGDLNNDGVVNTFDLLQMLAVFGVPCD
jgi:hypothetical protein